MRNRGLLCLLGCGLAWMLGESPKAPAAADPAAPPTIDFNRDIRPILSDNCYQCHGPDKNKRKGDLRLDIEEGKRVVVPGKPAESELYRRITSEDQNERMPYASSGKKLSSRQIGLIKKWIEQGAEWKGHWAYLKPMRPPVPPSPQPSPTQGGEGQFVRNEVDRFILAMLNEANLKPSPEADRLTLIRRLSFDLTGLPPSPEEVEAFQKSASRNPQSAIEELVDRLLASPHYGERMAMYWLDVVRYADSIGYHSDNPMNVSPYRDYVIKAFNDNKRFDQFTIEQIAGDLLPNATLEQKVASAYNRLLQTTEEGGAQAKEYRAKYDADRVRNVSSVWLGATMGCCQCHDHKFDPYTTRDFYRMAAFFADIQEAPVGRREAGIPVPTEQQAAELKKLEEAIVESSKGLEKPRLDLALLDPYGRIATFLQQPAYTDFSKHARRKADLMKTIPTTMISISGQPHPVRILPRGNWLDDSGEIVNPAVPHFLPGSEIQGTKPTRLDLAQWIVSKDNPLTARVFVNRLWKLYFGQGLSKSLEDFGSQGEWPSHPELLDWLAVEFMESGWDVKHMVKLLVTSGAYRQSSQPRDDLKERDPYNRLYARQSRFRLDAEMVRDNALAVSGLLVRKIGGPSVKPYQPAGYWAALNFPTREWQNDTGDNLYRRSLYTHWQRTFPHPSLLAFDAPSREECTVERARSNIPQQALVLLNDPIYVEAARVFAERIIKEGGASAHDRVKWAYGCALSRDPKDEELKILAELYAKHAREYAEDKPAAQKLLSTGAHPLPKDMDATELAAWTSVARVILNLHETITRN